MTTERSALLPLALELVPRAWDFCGHPMGTLPRETRLAIEVFEGQEVVAALDVDALAGRLDEVAAGG